MTDSDLLTETTADALDRTLAAAHDAAGGWAATPVEDRARALVAVADGLVAHGNDLVALAHDETGLPEARLHGELTRTAVQLRMFATLLRDGGFLDVVLDRADPDFAIAPRPDLRRYRIPIGPVLVFAAGNFPFAFSVAGGDTASALAAGCPVVVKAHPGHPATSAATAAVVRAELDAAGVPAGVFAVVAGQDAGVAALRDHRIAAAGFTGSVAGGRALFDIAAARPTPIPFFGELGSVDPVVVTAEAIEQRGDALASGYVDSFTLGVGQFCTSPGLLLVPAGTAVVDAIAARVAAVPPARMLTARIADGYRHRLGQTVATPGVDVVVEGEWIEPPSPTECRVRARR